MLERIILHAGTPKTGTTSLQIALQRHRAELVNRGLFYPTTMATPYPTPDGSAGAKPKHQWLVDDLLAEDGSAFREHMAAALAEAVPSTRTVVLSTEGLFNHWWDFSAAGRSALAALSRAHPIELWVWFREPVGFFISNYVQMLKNPQGQVACYGRDWSPDAMLDDPWFARHLDYMEFIDDVAATLGPGSIRLFGYRGMTVADFFAAVGLADFAVPEYREHGTLGAFGVEALRLLNRRALSADAKTAAINLLSRLDTELGEASGAFALDISTRARILSRCKPGLDRLLREHRLKLEPPG